MEHVEAHSMKLLGTIRASELKSSAVHFQAGDVLYGRLRPYLNKVLLATFEGLCSAEFIVFAGHSHLNSSWLAYFLNSYEFVSYASHLNAGDRPRVDFDQLRPYELLLAPRLEQDRIVAELEKQITRLDASTAALKRARANLKRYRASVLKAACEGRLVPTEAELARKEGRIYEPADKLLERILRERRARWEADTLTKLTASGKPPKDDSWKRKYKEPSGPDTTDLPSLPEGWSWANLEQLSSVITSGSRGWGDLYAESGPLFIRAQDIKSDVLKLEGVAHVNLASNLEGTRTRVHRHDLLITITGANVTRAALVQTELEAAYVSQHVGLVRPVATETSSYLHSWTISPTQGRKELLLLAYGAGKPGLNLENLRSLAVGLPPIKEQERISEELDARIAACAAVEAAIESQLVRASNLRRAVLQGGFSGKLLPQDPNDEPASVLLERIRAERASSAAAKARKRNKKEPAYA
jgi:type I restriction enzyme S subunit